MTMITPMKINASTTPRLSIDSSTTVSSLLGKSGLRKPANHVTIAFAPDDPHGPSLRDVLALGDDVHTLAGHERRTGRPKVCDRDALEADEVRPRRGRDIPVGAVRPTVEEEPGEAAAVRQVPDPRVGHGDGDRQAGGEDQEGLR